MLMDIKRVKGSSTSCLACLKAIQQYARSDNTLLKMGMTAGPGRLKENLPAFFGLVLSSCIVGPRHTRTPVGYFQPQLPWSCKVWSPTSSKYLGSKISTEARRKVHISSCEDIMLALVRWLCSSEV